MKKLIGFLRDAVVVAWLLGSLTLAIRRLLFILWPMG